MIADTAFAVQGDKAAASETTEAADKDTSGVCCAIMFAHKPVELNIRVIASDKRASALCHAQHSQTCGLLTTAYRTGLMHHP